MNFKALVITVFTAVYLYQLLLRRIDQQLEELFSACRKDYIMGKNAAQLGLEVPVYDLPADLIMAFDQHLPGFVPLIACEGKSVFTSSEPSAAPLIWLSVSLKAPSAVLSGSLVTRPVLVSM